MSERETQAQSKENFKHEMRQFFIDGMSRVNKISRELYSAAISDSVIKGKLSMIEDMLVLYEGSDTDLSPSREEKEMFMDDITLLLDECEQLCKERKMAGPQKPPVWKDKDNTKLKQELDKLPLYRPYI